MIQMLGLLTLSQRSLRLSSFLLILFSFFLSASLIYTILFSTSLILSSASVILLLIPSRVVLISFIALFMIDLEKAMATHSSTLLAWKIPWMEEPGSERVIS